jgi:dihydroorotase
MNNSYYIKQINVVNEGSITNTNLYVSDGMFKEIGDFIIPDNAIVIDGTNRILLPGVIDAQVHFRDPGLIHKADLYTESCAAVAGGVTSFIDMPNTLPNVLSIDLLEEKYTIASQKSIANFGFLLGVNSDNLTSVLESDLSNHLAITDDGLYFTKKGNLLADSPEIMERLFSNCSSLIAIHSEKEAIIEQNEKLFFEKYGDDIPFECHPLIRSEQACFEATERAIGIAEKYNTRLHILHLSTVAETALFRNDIPLDQKKITTEVSIHHLWFSDKDYEKLGCLIKWNPAIKTLKDKEGLLKALIEDKIDIITTDHAPHSLAEKNQPYLKSMSGAPMIQHSLNVMLELYKQGKISLEKIVEKMCHNPSILYKIKNRGFIRKNYFADFVIVDLNQSYTVNKSNIMYKCGWSPLEGTTFQSKILMTFVNGNLVFDKGVIFDQQKGMRLEVI